MGNTKLLEKARASPHDWTAEQVISLLESFGFECWEGARHTLCRHKDDPSVYHTVPRHRRLRAYVVRDAVKLIDRVQARASERERANEQHGE